MHGLSVNNRDGISENKVRNGLNRLFAAAARRNLPGSEVGGAYCVSGILLRRVDAIRRELFRKLLTVEFSKARNRLFVRMSSEAC